MGVPERARRKFVIHVFAGLAASTGCRHEQPVATPPSPSPDVATSAPVSVSHEAGALDSGSPLTPDAPIETPGDASRTDASVSTDAARDAPAPNALDRPLRASDLHMQLPGANPFGAPGRMGGGGTTGDTPLIGSRAIAGGAAGPSGGMGTGLGYGAGAGGFRGRTAVMPVVRPGQPSVMGNLPSEVVRRVTLRNINQLRFCYEQGVAQNPQLQGRIVVRYVIGPQGTVATASVESTTLTMASVPQCFVNAVRRWQFPAPDGGGVVMVLAPFTLTYPQ